MLSVDKQAGVNPNKDKQFFTSGFMLERIEYCSVTVILHVRTRHHFSFWFEEMKKKHRSSVLYIAQMWLQKTMSKIVCCNLL